MRTRRGPRRPQMQLGWLLTFTRPGQPVEVYRFTPENFTFAAAKAADLLALVTNALRMNRVTQLALAHQFWTSSNTGVCTAKPFALDITMGGQLICKLRLTTFEHRQGELLSDLSLAQVGQPAL